MWGKIHLGLVGIRPTWVKARLSVISEIAYHRPQIYYYEYQRILAKLVVSIDDLEIVLHLKKIQNSAF